MRKVFLLCLIIISKLASAQTTVSVSGTITDQKGKPIPFAFVSDSQHPYATYSDPSGVFSLMADPASNLIITAQLYTVNKIKLDNSANIKVVMTEDSASKSQMLKTSALSFFTREESIVDHNVSLNRIGTGQEELHGSRFLFNDWVHGFAITPKDSIKQSDDYLFNYDKVGGNLLFTRNKTTALLVIKQEVKRFTLYDENGRSYVFEDVQAISPQHYVQVLSSGPKYKIYKDLSTVFIKANFNTNGITSSGNNYDEYKDENVYYVVKLPAGTPQKTELRTKSIKAVFGTEPDKVKKFLSDNNSNIDEDYLKSLGEYMNQE